MKVKQMRKLLLGFTWKTGDESAADDNSGHASRQR
jgi:hypothetical protein